MSDDPLSNSLKTILPQMMESHKQTHNEGAKNYLDKLNINRPEEFYFHYNYKQGMEQRQALGIKLLELHPNKKLSSNYDTIYFNYNDVEHFISQIMKENEGYACSTDKASTIIHAVMKNNFYENEKNYKLKNHSFSLPKYRGIKDWETLVFAFINVRSTKSVEQLFLATLKITSIYEKINKKQGDFYKMIYNNIKNDPILSQAKVLDIGGKKVSLDEYLNMNAGLEDFEKRIKGSEHARSVSYYIKKSHPNEYKKIRKEIHLSIKNT